MRFYPEGSEDIYPAKISQDYRLYGFLNRKTRGIRDKEKGESLPQSLFHFGSANQGFENFTGLSPSAAPTIPLAPSDQSSAQRAHSRYQRRCSREVEALPNR